MKVLVTGAAGFIGRCLVEDRLRRGDEVVALDHKAADWPAPAEAVVADLGDRPELEAALRGCEVVFHLAAAHLDQSTPAAEYERVNVACVRDLVRLAKDAGVRRFVHCSTVGVFGHVERPPAAEDGPKDPGNVYERSKLRGEEAALEEARNVGLDCVVVRPAWVYGSPCPRTRRLLRLVEKRKFFYFGSGANLRHPIHIDDMLAGFHLASERGPAGAVYNIAGPEVLALRDLIGTIAAALDVRPPRLRIPLWIGWLAGVAGEVCFKPLGKQPPISRRSLAFFRNNNSYSIAAAEADLGFRPGIGVADGMKRVVAELRSA